MSALLRKLLKYWLAQGWCKVTDSHISSNSQRPSLIVLVRKGWSLLMFPLLYSHIETSLYKRNSKRERNTTHRGIRVHGELRVSFWFSSENLGLSAFHSIPFKIIIIFLSFFHLSNNQNFWEWNHTSHNMQKADFELFLQDIVR